MFERGLQRTSQQFAHRRGERIAEAEQAPGALPPRCLLTDVIHQTVVHRLPRDQLEGDERQAEEVGTDVLRRGFHALGGAVPERVFPGHLLRVGMELEDLDLWQGIADHEDLPILAQHHAPRREPTMRIHTLGLSGVGGLHEDLSAGEHEFESGAHASGFAHVGKNADHLRHAPALAGRVHIGTRRRVDIAEFHHPGDHR